MNLQEIQKAWAEDAIINKAHLDDEALNIDRLHSKYLNELINANMLLAKKKSEYHKLWLEKWVFYTEGAKSIKDIQKAPRGAVLKSEAEKYVLGDDDIIALSLDIALYQEKYDTLKSILITIGKRNYVIKEANLFIKFMAGN